MNARELWLQGRMTGIGGSDAAAVLGLSRWKTPLQVYQEKRGEVLPTEDNEPMLWGRALEPVIRQQYAERNQVSVSVPTVMMRHPKYEFMIANVDGLTDNGRLLEVKTTRNSTDWGEAGSDEVPQAYLLQVQHYLTVTELDVADVAVLIGGSDYRQYVIEADRELQEMIIEGEAMFWANVQSQTMPEPVSYADAIVRYGKASIAQSIEADISTSKAVSQLVLLREEIKALEGKEELLKADIMKYMGENDTLTLSNIPLITWKAQAGSKRFDAKAFEAAHPDLHSQFVKVGEPSRRFLIK